MHGHHHRHGLYHWFEFINHMHTQPLLFDECWSILEKIAALYYKLNALIEDYNQFKDDFFKWKEQVENTLEDLQNQINVLEQRITAVENDITIMKEDIANLKKLIENIQTAITNIQNDITNIKNDITNINKKIETINSNITIINQNITKIENQLDALDIDVPVDILSGDSSKSAVGKAWLDWLGTICGTSFQRNSWTFVGKVTDDDTETPKYGVSIGKVISNVIKCKLPLIASIPYTPTGTTTTQIMNELKTFASSHGLINLLYPLTPTTGFFNITLQNSFPNDIDEFKFTGSYIPFYTYVGGTASAPPVVRIGLDSSGSVTAEYCNVFNVNIRLQITAGVTRAKLCVLGDGIYLGYYNKKIYLYNIVEIE